MTKTELFYAELMWLLPVVAALGVIILFVSVAFQVFDKHLNRNYRKKRVHRKPAARTDG